MSRAKHIAFELRKLVTPLLEGVESKSVTGFTVCRITGEITAKILGNTHNGKFFKSFNVEHMDFRSEAKEFKYEEIRAFLNIIALNDTEAAEAVRDKYFKDFPLDTIKCPFEVALLADANYSGPSAEIME